MCYYNNSIRFLILLFLVRGKLYGYYPKRQRTCEYQERLDILFPKLNQAYPDKKISGLYKDHKKWGETVTELYRA